jgi:hypothetical protein
MKQLIFRIYLCILLASCSSEPCYPIIDCELTQGTSSVTETISQDFLIYLPKIIITNDPFYSNLGLEIIFSDEDLIPSLVRIEIINEDEDIIHQIDSLAYVTDSSDILLWDGKIGNQEQVGLFRIHFTVTFTNGEFFDFNIPFIATNCEELEICYQAQENCNLITCIYYDQHNQNPDFPIQLCM